ncbi:hypothetical protein SCHPADRAFT_900530, partial [Schizopora paradoxa]
MASWRKPSVSDIEFTTGNRRGLPAITRSHADAGTTTRESRITTVVSDTVDHLEERTVPESALPSSDPRDLHWSTRTETTRSTWPRPFATAYTLGI